MILDETMKIARRRRVYPISSLFVIFNLANEGVPARQLLLDVMLYSAEDTWLDSTWWHEAKNVEAIAEISKAFIRAKGSSLKKSHAPYDSQKTMCRYHWHTMTDSACYQTKREWGWLRDGNEA